MPGRPLPRSWHIPQAPTTTDLRSTALRPTTRAARPPPGGWTGPGQAGLFLGRSPTRRCFVNHNIGSLTATRARGTPPRAARNMDRSNFALCATVRSPPRARAASHSRSGAMSRTAQASTTHAASPVAIWTVRTRST